LISGDEKGWFVVDIYGVIGEDGDDTDHDFHNSRVVRKLDAVEMEATWSKDDWVVCKSDTPDPNLWNSDECGTAEGAPTHGPTSAPTRESQKECQFFFSELSDVEDVPYIEIKSTCPGKTISRDLSVVSWKEYGLSCSVSLKGVVVPDDGFIIICANKIQHQHEYGGYKNIGGKWRDMSVCDIEDYMLLAGHGSNSLAIKDADAGCEKNNCVGSNCHAGCSDKYLDIYGYPGASLDYTDHQFEDCRAARKMHYPYGSSPFNPNVYEVICLSFGFNSQPGEDADPREWKEVPLVLFFTEFCDPVDNKNKRVIELYSPNKRNYKIKDDLIVMKWEGSSAYPSYTYQSLKGQKINSKGHLVLCMNYYAYSGNICDVQTGFSGVTKLSGSEHFALAKCTHPSNDCHYIDIYGTPGTIAGAAQDFTDGKVFRRRTVPAPKRIYDSNHWVVVNDINADQCGAGTTPPPVPAPSPGSGGGPGPGPGPGPGRGPSKGKGKGKYWRRK